MAVKDQFERLIKVGQRTYDKALKWRADIIRDALERLNDGESRDSIISNPYAPDKAHTITIQLKRKKTSKKDNSGSGHDKESE